jgi:membrane protease YdiL (CAAX protease family)
MTELATIDPATAMPAIVGLSVLLCAGLTLDLLLAVMLLRGRIDVSRLLSVLRARPCTWRDVACLVLVILAGRIALDLIFAVAESCGWPVDALPMTFWLVPAFVFFHVPGVIAVLALAHLHGLSFRAAFCGGDQQSHTRQIIFGAVLAVAAMPVVWMVTLIGALFLQAVGFPPEIQPVADMLLAAGGYPWWTRAAALLLAVVLVPAAEELMFRGVCLPYLAGRIGSVPAIIALSLVFAVLHLHVQSMAPLFVLSVGFCLAYGWSGSIITPIAMHATANLISIAFMWLGGVQSNF